MDHNHLPPPYPTAGAYVPRRRGRPLMPRGRGGYHHPHQTFQYPSLHYNYQAPRVPFQAPPPYYQMQSANPHYQMQGQPSHYQGQSSQAHYQMQSAQAHYQMQDHHQHSQAQGHHSQFQMQSHDPHPQAQGHNPHYQMQGPHSYSQMQSSHLHHDNPPSHHQDPQSNNFSSGFYNSYYQNPNTSSASGPTNKNAINAIFDQFRQPDDPPDEFSINATMAYFDALGLQLDDVTLVPLSKALGSESMGEFKRKEFTDGWMQLGADSLPKMQEKLQELRQSLDTNEEYFKEVYKWAFNWAKPAGTKALPLESATEWWRLLLQSRFGDNGHLERWTVFLNEKWKKSIPKDTWNMFYEFIVSARADPTLTGYDENGSYPSTIDAYVDYYRNLEQ